MMKILKILNIVLNYDPDLYVGAGCAYIFFALRTCRRVCKKDIGAPLLSLFLISYLLFFNFVPVHALTTSTGGRTTTVSAEYPEPGGGGPGGGDTTPPAAVADLIAIPQTTATITLTWTAPGDDGNSGTASEYDIRYALTSAIASGWDAATPIANEPAPLVAGTSQSVVVSGLAPETTYYFVLKTRDEIYNWSAISNIPSAKTLAIGESPDTTAPAAVLNLTAGSITTSTITLSWTAPGDDGDIGMAAAYDIRYSASGAITSGNWASATQATNEPAPLIAGSAQSFKVADLTPDTTYYFALKTRDEVYNWSALSNSPSAKTLEIGLPDTTPPVITNLQVSEITSTTAKITWTTDEAATSSVSYGQTTNYEIGTVSQAQFLTSHSFTLTNLSSQTTYHFQAKAADASGNLSVTPDQSFTTLDITPPIISNVAVEPDITFVTITWQTNESADSQAAYGLTSQLGSLTSDVEMVTEHSLPITGLVPNKKYFYVARSTDASGNQGSGDLASFTTLKDANPPANVSNFQAQAGDQIVNLSWQNPPDTDLAGVLIRRSTTGYPSDPTKGDKVYQGSSQSFQDTGLTNNVLYYYTAFAFDTSDNYAAGALAQATPQAGLLAQCRDGLDNDGDGKIDFPADPGCSSLDDNNETDAIQPQPQCNDGLDNDGDGKTDYPNDPGCASSADNDEIDEIVQPPVVVPPAGGTAALEYRLYLADFQFSAVKGKIPIAPEYKIASLIGTGFIISLEDARSKKSIESMIVNVGSGSYLFNFQTEKKQWQTEVTLPRAAGMSRVDIIASFYDQTSSVVSFELEALPYGQIFEKVAGQKKPLEGAKVSLLTSPTLWPAGDFGQLNPQVTGADGAFGFLVPPGQYILKVEKDDYRTEETGYFSSKGVVINSEIELLKLPPSLAEVIKPGARLTENVVEVAKNLSEKTVFVSKVVVKEVTKGAKEVAGKVGKTAKETAVAVKEAAANPEVQKAAKEVAAPVVAGAAAAGTASTVGLLPLLNYLRFLFTQPVLLFKRRKRKGWGVVYNSLTKLPLDLVTVRLTDANTGRIIQSRVTDKEGRYAFFPSPGLYKIEIAHSQFKFPTDFLGALKEDGIYLDLYHGEVIKVEEKGTAVTANIPLDPALRERPIGRLIWQLVWRRLQHSLSLISLLLAGTFLIWVPSYLTAGLFVFQIILYLLFRRLAIPAKPKSWGIVYDEKTRRPLSQAIARIFDRQYNKLLETQITDARGRYSFLVGRNVYYLTHEKNGYHKKQSEPIDLSSHPEPVAVVGKDVGLAPVVKEQGGGSE